MYSYYTSKREIIIVFQVQLFSFQNLITHLCQFDSEKYLRKNLHYSGFIFNGTLNSYLEFKLKDFKALFVLIKKNGLRSYAL